MKISGLASGMDTESIINDMMEAHRLPLNKITQQKQYLEWQLNDYRTINRDIRSASDKIFDTMMKSSTFMAKTVSVSNENADRKSTRLNSSHVSISYAVFCLKKKNIRLYLNS